MMDCKSFGIIPIASIPKVKKDIYEENGKRIAPIILVEFSNGHLKFSRKIAMEFICYKNNPQNFNSGPKRFLVAKSNRLLYSGSNIQKNLSTVLKIGIFNKEDFSIEFYDVDLFHLKPVLKCMVIDQSKEIRSYAEMTSDLTLIFGSKSKQKRVNLKQKYSSVSRSSSNLTDITIPMLDVTLEQNLSTENNTVAIIPPQNKSAINVDEVYNLNDVIPEDTYAALDFEAKTFLSANFENIQQWKKENKYSIFIIEYIENSNIPMDHHRAKILCYLHYMLCFLRTIYSDWRKKDPVPDVPQPFKQKIMNSFTINKSLPQRMKDKLLAYALVLGLILNNYTFNGTTLASSAKISVKRMVSIAYALGCHVSENKSNDAKIIQLKLPLYKFQANTTRRNK